MSARKRNPGQPGQGSREPQGTGAVAGIYEGDYGMIELEPDPYTGNGWLISINGVPSSHIEIGEPRQLAFEYMRWVATAVEAHIRDHGELDPGKLRITHLGGGACTLARYFADVYPESRNSVVELDGELAKLARRWFDIPRSPQVKIRVDDAREVAAAFTPDSRDVIVRDVFAGAVTPEGFTTVEFFQDCHRGLVSNGLYVANCGDHSDLQGAKAELAGMAEVWRHIAVIADPPMLKGRRYGNIVLIASDAELLRPGSPEWAAVARELLGGGVPAQYQDETWVRKFISGAKARQGTSS